MKTFLEELIEYFEKTPLEKLTTKWAKYDIEENKIGPTVEDFLANCSFYHFRSYYPIDSSTFEMENKKLSSEFSPGFFLPLTLKSNSYYIYFCNFIKQTYIHDKCSIFNN